MRDTFASKQPIPRRDALKTTPDPDDEEGYLGFMQQFPQLAFSLMKTQSELIQRYYQGEDVKDIGLQTVYNSINSLKQHCETFGFQLSIAKSQCHAVRRNDSPHSISPIRCIPKAQSMLSCKRRPNEEQQKIIDTIGDMFDKMRELVKSD